LNTKKYLFFEVDCVKYPDVAQYVYGSAIADHCKPNSVVGFQSESFDFSGDLKFFAVLLLFNFVTSRMPAGGIASWDDDFLAEIINT
jgi:hypothetical protein